ncbi:DNA protecting protein DprA [Nocardioides sp. YR527]|uniref:DNA-processing protein DprA n=1 Tax=Nocardioides sp. YR527 TaxID=1881028 RepID=UPI00087E0887|nr:DNA-processing protein DprA [Nocardioides sp. YR527]SDK86308.1 DNA protecting protein DprA [Nocardioides sp. YR527]
MTAAPVAPPFTDLERERLARIALTQLIEPGTPLLDTCIVGSTATEVYQRFAEEDPELGDDGLEARLRLAQIHPDRDLERATNAGFRYVIPGDEEWPAQVQRLAGQEPLQYRTGTPLGLWVRGPLLLSDLDRSVAIVGSRDATAYGADAAARIAADLAVNDFVTVSGAAVGIDAAAHRGALTGPPGSTVAVLAGGVDVPYPLRHRRLIDAIAESGAVISEIAPGFPVTRYRFLSRNRIIAALARGTVVVEAAARSGSLNTSHWAYSINTPVMAVPGQVGAMTSVGTHELVRSGKGVLVTDGLDVRELVGDMGEAVPEEPRGPVRRRDSLTSVEKQVLDAVPVGSPSSQLAIARSACLHPKTAGTALSRLEALGLAERFPDGWQLAPGAART